MDPMDQMVDNLREVEFRTGPEMIPAYLANMMSGLPTHTMTKAEAIKAANDKQLNGVMASAYDKAIKNHFGGPR